MTTAENERAKILAEQLKIVTARKKLADAIERELGTEAAVVLSNLLGAEPQTGLCKLARLEDALRLYMNTLDIQHEYPSVP